MITLSKTPQPMPALPDGSTVQLRPVGDARWRVLDPRGVVMGHLDAEATADGTRYHARRYHPSTASLRDLGGFWSAADAVECLRVSR